MGARAFRDDQARVRYGAVRRDEPNGGVGYLIVASQGRERVKAFRAGEREDSAELDLLKSCSAQGSLSSLGLLSNLVAIG